MPLNEASQKGHLGGVKELLTSGASADIAKDDGRTALHEAAWTGHCVIVKELLSAGAIVDKLDEVWRLKYHFLNPRQDVFTPILLAALYGHEHIVKVLLDHGASLDLSPEIGTTWLHEMDKFLRFDFKVISLDLRKVELLSKWPLITGNNLPSRSFSSKLPLAIDRILKTYY
ncbi:hypothetical protein AC1031_012205 [Aphanomyces cochlioides]|nr:hypothetical protein AC1031_012205 [Aphanomyces cochlioides]